MSEEPRKERGEESPASGEEGEAVPINWACTVCGYRMEGALPERCPDCGAAKEEFDEVPVPGF